MTIDMQQLARLKKAAKESEEQRIRAESARDEALAQLKELGYDNIEEAKEALAAMRKSIVDSEARIEEQIQKLLDDYPDLV